MKFRVKRYWELCDEVIVTARTAHEAIERAHEMPTDSNRAQFVPDSMNTDPDAEVWRLNEGGAS